jgi:SOS response regulatory protein OraA/RecX
LQKSKDNKEELQERIKHFKTDQRYRRYLIKKGFLMYLYQRLGVEMEKDEDCLSELSI